MNDVNILTLIFGGKSFGGLGNYIRDIENYCRSSGITTKHVCSEDLNPFSSRYVRYFSRALDWIFTMQDAQKKARKLNLRNPLCMDVVASHAYPNSLTVVHGMLSKELATITSRPKIHDKLAKIGIRLPIKQSIFMGRIRELEINGLLAARKIIVSNTQVGEYIRSLCSVSVEHIPNPLNTEKFRPLDKIECKKKLSMPLDKKFVLFYSNMFEKYSDKYPEWELDLVKRGFYVKNLDNSVKYEDMPLWYNASDLTVMPMRIYGIGRFCLESLSCGTPFLSNNCPIGYTVPINEIIDAISNFDFDNVDRSKLRESVSGYSQDVIIPRILDLHGAGN